MKTKLLLLAFVGVFAFAACSTDDDDEPTPAPVTTPVDTTSSGGGGGGNTGCTNAPDKDMAKFGDTALAVPNITCNPNAFGIPRYGITAKSSDNSIRINVEIRGTDPADGTSYTQDPALGGGTSRVTVYFDAKNWTSVMDTTTRVYISDNGTSKSVCGTDITGANDRDATETMKVSMNVTCP